LRRVGRGALAPEADKRAPGGIGDSNVPLGFISLTENLMMIAMAIWMLVSPSLMPTG
jgi:hypothetical protein